MLLAALALIVPIGVAEWTEGEEVWGDLAPSWPGGGYAFAVCVGVLVPLSFAALIAPLGRLNRKKCKLRSLAWAAASLPGLASFQLLAAVITATFRPKHRENWDGFCYSRGNPCWIHVLPSSQKGSPTPSNSTRSRRSRSRTRRRPDTVKEGTLRVDPSRRKPHILML